VSRGRGGGRSWGRGRGRVLRLVRGAVRLRSGLAPSGLARSDPLRPGLADVPGGAGAPTGGGRVFRGFPFTGAGSPVPPPAGLAVPHPLPVTRRCVRPSPVAVGVDEPEHAAAVRPAGPPQAVDLPEPRPSPDHPHAAPARDNRPDGRARPFAHSAVPCGRMPGVGEFVINWWQRVPARTRTGVPGPGTRSRTLPG
jgi:hypothetical protein